MRAACGWAETQRLKVARGVRDATLFGETVHLLVDQATTDAELVRAVGEPPAAVEIRPVAPTLEDVFVTLTRQAGAASAA